MQVIYISNRPEVFAETLDHVLHHLDWIDDVVVVAPGEDLERFQLDVGVDLTVVSDEEVLGLEHRRLAEVDHSSRSIMIRKGLLKQGLVDEVFLLSDDDYRPLKPVSEDFFFDGDRYRGFYSYDLAAWRWSNTDFDRAQHLTHQALLYLGCPHRSYAAHMPQVMDRSILQEAFESIERLTDSNAICEWSLFFNYGQAFHPERFAPPSVFVTLGWPEYPGSWPFHVRPSEYVFENFYPDLYAPGRLFDGLPTRFDPLRWEQTAFEKILRWYELEIRVSKLDFDEPQVDPWIRGSRTRRTAFSVLRRARKAVEYLALEERTRLAELAGQVQRLTDRIEQEDRPRQ